MKVNYRLEKWVDYLVDQYFLFLEVLRDLGWMPALEVVTELEG